MGGQFASESRPFVLPALCRVTSGVPGRALSSKSPIHLCEMGVSPARPLSLPHPARSEDTGG